MAPALGIRTVDDADEPFEARLGQRRPQGLICRAEVEQESIPAAVVHLPLVAVRPGRQHVLELERRIPVACSRHRPRMGAEADKRCVRSEPLAAELPDIMLAADDPHVGVGGIAYM